MASRIPEVDCEVIVVGSGNAGFCAALSASQSGASKVILIDKCPEAWVGGNSFFTAGAFRIAHSGLQDILPLVSNVDEQTAKLIDLDPYENEDFLRDMSRITRNRYDRKLGKALVEESNDSIKWLAELGLEFQLSFNRQAFKVNERFRFFGGLCLKTADGGAGLMKFHQAAAKKNGIKVLFSTAAQEINIHTETGGFHSLLAKQNGIPLLIKAKSIVLAAGGFESNPRMRAQYLGSGWDLAHVRGTPYNTGEVLEMCISTPSISARPVGQWSGCHSVAWDSNAPQNSGDRTISNEFTKSGYPLGITVNIHGKRFFDEGGDLRNYTYAKFGRAILEQPSGVAFQIWDQKAIPWLREEEYRDEIVEKIWGDSIEELAQKCVKKGLEDTYTFVNTVTQYNAAVADNRKEFGDKTWNPSVLDTLSTKSSSPSYSLPIPKSNWALSVDKGPYMAVKVGCGVTFTFGGLAVDPDTAGLVSNLSGDCIPGIFCAGEMVGGLFFENYPGGSGLTSGAVFGRKAGNSAAIFAALK